MSKNRIKDLKYEKILQPWESIHEVTHADMEQKSGRNYQGSNIRIFSKVEGGESPGQKGPVGDWHSNLKVSLMVLWVGWAPRGGSHVEGGFSCNCRQTKARTRAIWGLSGVGCPNGSCTWLAGDTVFGWQLTCDLCMDSPFVWSFLTVWRIGSKSKCSPK